MTADERFPLIRVKVEWAKKHLCDLEVARNRFINSKPYRIEREGDPQTGYNIYRVFDIHIPPVEIGLIAGDLIHNLRSALDHLTYQLVLINGAAPTKQTTFPVFEDATKYRAGFAGKVNGMAQCARDAIDAVEPYQGGKGTGLWVLHYLDIADKHHTLLTPLMNVTEASFTFPGYWESNYVGVGGISLPNFGKPLKDGDVIATREAKMDNGMNLIIDVAFTEPDVLKGKPVIETLQRLVDLVDNLILQFKQFLT